MSVPEQTPYKEYTGNGVTKNFALEFTCDSKQELKVFIDNVESELSTWSLVGGSVVFTTAPASDSKIVLKRATKLERTTNYSSTNNSFRPEAINKDLDRVWYALQDQSYKLGQYDLDYAYAVNTSNQAKQIAQNAHQRADDAYDLADTTNTEIRDISRGGTGADNAADARTNLEIYSQAEVDALIASGGAGNIVAIGGGGTGGTTAEEARTNLDVLSKTETNTAITNSTKQATESVKGQAKIATTAIAQAGTNNTDFMTPVTVRGVSFGQGQQRKTRTLIKNVVYTNTSNKPIVVGYILAYTTNTAAQVRHTFNVGGIAITACEYSAAATYRMTYHHLVLPSEDYSIELGNSEFPNVYIVSAWEIS